MNLIVTYESCYSFHTLGQISNSDSLTFGVASDKKHAHSHKYEYTLRLTHNLTLSLPLIILWSRR